ncbi:MAG: hypothetical protein K2Y29_01400 [Beijerinckiaceae bacterium]|nr:hypothetical protein [Beijerinckiaceae bacterium]
MRALAITFVFTFCTAVAAWPAEQIPQAVPDSQSKPGETLSERLDRTDGVIKPPPVDAPIQIEPQRQDSNMPVLKPPAPPQEPQQEPQAAPQTRRSLEAPP